MAEEIKKILTVETGRSFDNIRQLRSEIRQLNQVVETGTKLVADENGELQEVAVTSEEYDKAVKQLAEDKRTLADITNLNRNAWNSEADSVDRSAKSYQQLQAEMRRLRVEWRNTSSADDRKRIAAEIADINGRLKEMDAETGFYQRNVGDYFNSIQKGLAGIPGPAGKAVAGISSLTGAFKSLISTPVVAFLGAISIAAAGVASVLKDLNERVEGNEDITLKYMEATERARAITDAYIARLDALSDTYVKNRSRIEEWVASAKIGFKEFILNAGQAIASGRGLADAFTNAWISIRQSRAGADGFLEKEKEITQAYKNYLDTYRDSIKKQAEIEKVIAESNLISADSERDATERLDAVKLSIQKTNELFDEQKRVFLARKAQLEAEAATGKNSIEVNNKLAETEAELTRLGTAREHQLRRLIALRARLNKEVQARIDAFEDEKEVEAYDIEQAQRAADMMEENGVRRVEIEDETTAAIVAAAKERIGIMDLEAYKDKKNLDDEKKRNAARKQMYSTFGDTVATVFDGIADILESSSTADEKATRQAKALKIAAATIDTIGGAVAAFAAAQEIPPPYGQIIGAANAAAVTTMGIVNIAKIRSTPVSKDSATSGGGGSPIVTAPPAVVQEVPVTRTLTGASEAQAVNQAPAETKVVLVMSELEAKQGEIAAKQVETTF